MNELVDGPVVVHLGDALSVLREMASESVHCVVTSPPYFGLRDYGATGQLGLEATPAEYVTKLVEIFREVRRVLHRSGSAWCNLGDSYASGGRDWYDGSDAVNGQARGHRSRPLTPPGLKPKDLVGIPWMVAFALRTDGWWLRSDIVWAKPNPMPESVTDRPTKAHEYVFLLTKAERYFYDADAVREVAEYGRRDETDWSRVRVADPRDGRAAKTEVAKYHVTPATGRNLRSVWTIATQPYPEAHFATFPEDLVIPCIKAGTSEHGVCPQCGSPWERVMERSSVNGSNAAKAGTVIAGKGHVTDQVRADHDVRNGPVGIAKTLGWQPTCTHSRDPAPATVLDPFAGSGTTLAVARRLGRRAVGIELQADYLPLIAKRIAAGALPLLELLQVEEVIG